MANHTNEFRESGNPYQPPQKVFESDEISESERAGLVPNSRPTHFPKLLLLTWSVLLLRLRDFLILGVIFCGTVFILSATAIILGFTIRSLNIFPHMEPVLFFLIGFSYLCICSVVFTGSVRYTIRLIRDGKTSISVIFEDWTLGVKYFFSSLVVYIALLLFLAPYIACILLDESGVQSEFTRLFLSYAWLPYIYAIPMFLTRACWNIAFISDRGEGPIQAIRSSIRFSRGHWFDLASFIIIHGIVLYLATALTVMLGFIFTYPALCCSIAVVYLSITDQNISTEK